MVGARVAGVKAGAPGLSVPLGEVSVALGGGGGKAGDGLDRLDEVPVIALLKVLPASAVASRRMSCRRRLREPLPRRISRWEQVTGRREGRVETDSVVDRPVELLEEMLTLFGLEWRESADCVQRLWRRGGLLQDDLSFQLLVSSA